MCTIWPLNSQPFFIEIRKMGANSRKIRPLKEICGITRQYGTFVDEKTKQGNRVLGFLWLFREDLGKD